MMRLSEAAKVLNAQWIGEDCQFDSVGTDSRNIQKNQLFVALKGEKFDGHIFAEEALKQGAAAVMVNKRATNTTLNAALLVEDTYQALGQLAAYWRQQFESPVIAVTGSNGKTSVKEMLATIFTAVTADKAKVLATEGNLNNHIGVPLTLLKLKKQHQYAVVEMGMNHQGEIAYLTTLAKPNVVVINNAGDAHLGELGSYEAIAKAKGEILEGLVDDGTAILNADDTFYPLWKALADGKKVLSFGIKAPCDVSATYKLKVTGSEILLKTMQGNIKISLFTPGLHNVKNALAASAVALSLGVSIDAIKQGLENYHGAKGRLQSLIGYNNALVIDDTYNANPSSMKVAIDVLRERKGKKILVLGDMGELGHDENKMHEEIGMYAKQAHIDALFTLGNLSALMSDAFGEGAMHFASLESLVEALKKSMEKEVTVLVKGSRFMAMERVVKAISGHEKSI